jgi:hypothetical protein
VSAAASERRRRQRKNAPRSNNATPTIDPTTAPATVPVDTPLCSFSFVGPTCGLATIGVVVTVSVTIAPDTVTTRVLMRVVCVYAGSVRTASDVTAASVLVIDATEVVDGLDVEEDVMLVVEDALEDCTDRQSQYVCKCC